MIPAFHLKLPAQIVFGSGKLSKLTDYIPQFGTKPLVVLGQSSFSSTNNHTSLQNIFEELKSTLFTVNITSEPSPTMINNIVAKISLEDIDMIIAIGGGSTLDAGKAISAMLVEGGEISRFLEGVGTEKPSGRKLPFIAIPTTSGTGSEATSNGVITSVGQNGFKKSFRHDNFIPDLALVDPCLTLSCPKKLTSSCGMDCFTQLVEGYLSTGSSRLTNAMALDGIKMVSRSLQHVYSCGENLQARTDLSYASLLSGIVLTNAGLGTVHGFASAIGALFPIPHGVICGSLMANVNNHIVKSLRSQSSTGETLSKYTVLGRICSDTAKKSDRWCQDFFLDYLEQLAGQLLIPRLHEYGVTLSDIETIVAQSANKNNPVQFTSEELSEIIQENVMT